MSHFEKFFPITLSLIMMMMMMMMMMTMKREKPHGNGLLKKCLLGER
jgi:hypothetical protein